MDTFVSACNIYVCESCEHRVGGSCPGCREGNQLAGRNSEAVCAVYECVESHGIGSCLDCPESACELKRDVETICPMRSRFEKKRWWAGRIARAMEGRKHPVADETGKVRMPERVINRLRWYLTALNSFADEGAESVSSWQLAERVGVSAALIRKDLSRFGEFGTPSLGYRLDFLRERLAAILRLDSPKRIAWVGACSLRHSSATVERLAQNNCRIVGVFDVDRSEIGARIGEFDVLPVESIREKLAGSGVSAAVVAIPGERAQEISRELVELGAGAILNMSGEMLVLPGHVKVTSLDLAAELLDLCYYCRG